MGAPVNNLPKNPPGAVFPKNPPWPVFPENPPWPVFQCFMASQFIVQVLLGDCRDKLFHLLLRLREDHQTMRSGFLEHPAQRHLRRRGSPSRIAATHIRMTSGKPDLLHVLPSNCRAVPA